MKSGVAVVTGGASGLGKAMAEEAARRGMKVVIADVEAGAMEQVVNDLRATGTEAIGVLTDVTNAELVEALAVATEQSFGPPNLLFNNAGVASGGPIWGKHRKGLEVAVRCECRWRRQRCAQLYPAHDRRRRCRSGL